MTKRAAFLAIAFALSSAGVGHAAFIPIPTLSVYGTDAPTTAFGGAGSTVGPSFTLAAGTVGTDIVALVATGTNYINPTSYTMNAAGVMVAPASGGAFGGVPGTTNPGGGVPAPPALPPGGFPVGAILIGNSTLGWFPLFLPTAANGLGSSNPTITVTTNRTLNQVFGLGADPAGGWGGRTLQLVTNDSTGDYFNNNPPGSGGITVTTVPEPSSMILAGLGGVVALAYARRRRAA